MTIYSAHVVIVDGDKVVLVQHGPAASHLTDVYGLPGGRMESGETEKQAAARELAEETGLRTTEENLQEYPNNSFQAQITRKDGVTREFSMKVFRCNSYSGTIHNGTAETKPMWVKLQELDNYKLLPNVKSAILASISN